MRLVMIILYLFLIIIGVTFAVLNAEAVTVNLYFTVIKMPVSLLITLTWGIGLLMGFLFGLYKYWCLKLTVSQLKSQLKVAQQEIKNLRGIPLKNEN